MNREIQLKLEIARNQFILAWNTIFRDFHNDCPVEYNGRQFRKDAVNLGILLYKHGGFSAMIDAHSNLPDPMKRQTELAWSQIGIW